MCDIILMLQTPIHIHTSIHICTHPYTSTHIRTSIHICTHLYTHTHPHTSAHPYISIHINAHLYTSIHIHTSIGSTPADNIGCFAQLHAGSREHSEVSRAMGWVQPIPHGSLRPFASSHVSIPISECQLSPGLIPNSACVVGGSWGIESCSATPHWEQGRNLQSKGQAAHRAEHRISGKHNHRRPAKHYYCPFFAKWGKKKNLQKSQHTVQVWPALSHFCALSTNT